MIQLGPGVSFESLVEDIMQKSLTLLVLGVGLVLVSARATFAKIVIPPVYFGSTTHLFNVNLNRLFLTGYPDSAGDGAGPLAPTSHQSPNRPVTTVLNLSGAISTGALTLLLLQRRQRPNSVLRPPS